MNRALFIDRDGVMNQMVKYDYGWDSPQTCDDVKLVEEIEKVIGWANANNILTIEVSNQPGVAKGKMSQEVSDAIEDRVHELLKQKSVHIDSIYICPHHPKAVVPELKVDCDCRKPQPGLLIRAANENSLYLRECVFLGDKASDTQTGVAVGCKTVIFIHNQDVPEKVEEAKNANANFQVVKLSDAVPVIENLFKLM